MDCIFCKIVRGEVPCHKVWENEDFLAFLSIFPNTEGVTVVIPKNHYSSYVFDLPEDVRRKLIEASKEVANLLDEKLEDVGRTALVFEGFGVDHVHAKLFPMHGTKMKQWQPLHSEIETYFEKYPGYISTHDAKREDDEVLEKLVKKISQ
ncbi:MAG: Histidine triad domain protein [Candidatus Moranbacteria bacterium GW2011_GWE2_36_40]|nr:MAG: Histidine triad domain protein [Candidatus Moranbacteria bacterium GW2011_GWE2_36_40]